MAFIISGGTVISFAEYSDVTAMDQRLFEANEGFTADIVEDALEKSTLRILNKIKSTDWWRSYYIRQSGASINSNIFTSGLPDVPAPVGAKILARRDEFTDMCVYFALSEYLYPKIADFGNADSAERQKIGFFDEKYRVMFKDLIEAGDWYDFSGTDGITSDEKQPNRQNLARRR
jgi:hypothetical protein